MAKNIHFYNAKISERYGNGFMRDKILIVNDEMDIISMLKDYFLYNGYDVITATNGLEAIKKAQNQPDIILLDINMPYCVSNCSN